MQGKEVHQHPRQEGGRRSDVGAVLALVGASFLGALTSVALGWWALGRGLLRSV
jgi:hypothetical protein